MQYTTSLNYESNDKFDFSSIEATLLPNSFKVIDVSSDSMSFKGKGMSSTKQDPIRGATFVELKAKSGKLELHAMLGGVLFMSLFVCFFPPALMLILGVINSADSSIYSNLYYWVVLGPVISYWLRYRTICSLKSMLSNAIKLQSKKSTL